MNKIKILIVENEALLSLDLEVTFNEIGFNTIGKVQSSEEALEFCKTKSPNIVIMDIGINGALNGIDTAQVIHNSYNLPVLFVTGRSTSTIEKEIKSIPPGILFTKPVNYSELCTTISTLFIQE